MTHSARNARVARPFVELSLRKRRALCQRIRNRILCPSQKVDARIATYDLVEDLDYADYKGLDRAELPLATCQYLDFEFLHPSKRGVVYRAMAATLTSCFYDAVSDRAYDLARAAVDRDEFEAHEGKIETVPFWEGKRRLYRVIPRKPHRYASLGGSTYREYVEQRARDVVRDDPPTVHATARIDKTYHGGIGVIFTVDSDHVLSRELTMLTDRFIAGGCAGWDEPGTDRPGWKPAYPFDVWWSAVDSRALLLDRAQESASTGEQEDGR